MLTTPLALLGIDRVWCLPYNSLPDGDANEVDPTEDVVPSVHHAGVRQHGVLQHPYHILGESTA